MTTMKKQKGLEIENNNTKRKVGRVERGAEIINAPVFFYISFLKKIALSRIRTERQRERETERERERVRGRERKRERERQRERERERGVGERECV
jgi:hypothetical protein